MVGDQVGPMVWSQLKTFLKCLISSRMLKHINRPLVPLKVVYIYRYLFNESLYETEYLPRYFSLCELYILMCVYLVGFVMCEAAPSTHNFASKVYSPHDPKSFLKAVRKEVQCRFESYSKLYIVPMFLNHL